MKKLYFILLGALLAACFSTYFIPTLRGDLTPLSDEDAELRQTLIKHLEERKMDVCIFPISVELLIDRIKTGVEQPLHVGFDAEDCYFVCAYYNGPHEYENRLLCCPTEYTWMKCELPGELWETCYAGKLVVAFQINNSTFAQDILSEVQTVSSMIHFQRYTPEFHYGRNVKGVIPFDETFIYLNGSSEKDKIYYSVSDPAHDYANFSCVKQENNFYITIWLSRGYTGGDRYENDLQYEFGKYYDGLMEVMETGKYSVKYDSGSEYFYGLISIEDFVDIVKQ